MIESRIFHAVKCDRCGSYDDSEFIFNEDQDTSEDNAIEGDWLMDNAAHYCPNCWIYDSNDEKVILKPYPRHLKDVLKFLQSLHARSKVVKETKEYFDVLINFYRRDGIKSLREHEENYINNLALGKVIAIEKKYNSAVVRIKTE